MEEVIHSLEMQSGWSPSPALRLEMYSSAISLASTLTAMSVSYSISLCESGTQKVQAFSADFFFQEYVAMEYRNAVVLPEGMNPAKVAPFCCAGFTSFNAVSAVELQFGDWLAIIGCGGARTSWLVNFLLVEQHHDISSIMQSLTWQR